MNKNTIQQIAGIALTKPPFTANGRFPPSPYYRFLYQLAQMMKPKLSVVLGVCGGGCCYNLAKGHYAPVLGIDISNDYPDNIEFIQNEQPNFYFAIGDSIDEANGLYKEIDEKVSILFIDTIHEKTRTINEFEAWLPHLANDAVVLLDDLKREGMIDAWNYLIDKYGEGLRIDKLHIGGSPTDGGFGVIYNIEP